MKFSDEKRRAIESYILDKVGSGDPELSQTVAAAFDINRNTAHKYISRLVDEGVIERRKRGEYALKKTEFSYSLRRSEGELESDIEVFNKCLKPHLTKLPANVRQIWEYTFSEMVNNVIDHSAAEQLQVFIMQSRVETEVVIYDNGIGIFEKIKDHFGFPTLDDAVCELFKGKLTTDAKNHSGEGIFFSSKMMDTFLIVSDGKVFTNNKYDDSVIASLTASEAKGTLVSMTLSNKSKKNSQDIFDAYSNVDGGFTKTTIPLKNIFEGSPVSRSQAKRICHRLEKFEEVILDFDAIEWMGQGFAHQVFVVFRREHPNISLVPINMNEPVTKMYNHVMYDTEA